ncbi:MAG: hypothetical protein OWT28_03770 [Firmicutes bacterium]|nr:hypothetical protein [Bacillota bacterium]
MSEHTSLMHRLNESTRRLNDWLGDRLAFWLSTMACFYFITMLVVVPLFFSRPSGLVGWVQYLVQSIFQGVALPVLGYVARIAGERQEKVLTETHDNVSEQLGVLKDELRLAREERQALKTLVHEMHKTIRERI